MSFSICYLIISCYLSCWSIIFLICKKTLYICKQILQLISCHHAYHAHIVVIKRVLCLTGLNWEPDRCGANSFMGLYVKHESLMEVNSLRYSVITHSPISFDNIILLYCICATAVTSPNKKEFTIVVNECPIPVLPQWLLACTPCVSLRIVRSTDHNIESSSHKKSTKGRCHAHATIVVFQLEVKTVSSRFSH